jgi:N-acetylmuramoyl-L-alanine amidase-like protein
VVAKPAAAPAAVSPTSPAAGTWNDADWAVLDAKVRWAVAQRLDTLPVGSAIARLGRTFVGATYTPGTLEVPGPERVVTNLREFDCVTFVENLLAMTRFIRQDGVALLADRTAAEAAYAGYLEEIRYRGGKLDGYPSRLHYFSEWLSDNAERGRLRLLARQLGGAPDTEPLGFMSAHPAAYRQMAQAGVAEAIRAMEQRLNATPARWYVPEDRIAEVADRIQDGDIIAATSTLPGLDVAHTGIALRQAGRLHLLHAPLVGKAVEISALPLADRIVESKTQDGVMVARVEAASRP